jgi:AraC-like DNA-binding protein
MGYPVMRDSTLRSHYESVERVISAMRGQLDQPMTLRELARIGFASPYHFNRTFRQITGIPPLQFLYALRLDAAKRMLTETEKKVIDICYEVGYSSVGTFTHRFADVLGCRRCDFVSLLATKPGRPLIHPWMEQSANDHNPAFLLQDMSRLPAISAVLWPWAFSPQEFRKANL